MVEAVLDPRPDDAPDDRRETPGSAIIALLDELARTRGRMAGAFRSVREEMGLTEMESVTLAAVAGAAHPPTVSQIGRSLGHPRQVIQRAADALAARGLIVTRDNPDHKRAKLLLPTREGRALKRRGDTRGLAIAERLAGGLDPDAVRDLVARLRRTRAGIEATLRSSAHSPGGIP